MKNRREGADLVWLVRSLVNIIDYVSEVEKETLPGWFSAELKRALRTGEADQVCLTSVVHLTCEGFDGRTSSEMAHNLLPSSSRGRNHQTCALRQR